MNPQDPTPGNPQQQVIERLKTAVNVLVTVSNSPSVDQLAAAVGFTLILNKMGKHATAVYSGDTPSTIEFLTPAATLEKNIDSLRDFIVSLDKSKADKLRYKVEDNVVKIFITPYRTSLSEKDLNFSQGDFNVDAVVALGVSEREELDQAIIAHGRILHDATVITVSAGDKVSSLGAINWQDASAGALCEMLVSVGEALQPGMLDSQIATAYLTGIVAETERFRNQKTTPKVMTMSAQLMAAGANQQLIAAALDSTPEVPPAPTTTAGPDFEAAEAVDEPKVENPDGALQIEHEASPVPEAEPAPVTIADPIPEPVTEMAKSDPSTESGLNLNIEIKDEEEDLEKTNQITIDEHGNLNAILEEPTEQKGRKFLTDPMAGKDAEGHPLTGFGSDDGINEPHIDALAATPLGATMSHSTEAGSTLPPIPEPTPAPTPDIPLPDSVLTLPPAFDTDTLRSIEKTFDSTHIVQDPSSTIDEIEEVKHSPHLAEAEQMAQGVDTARDAVTSAINATPYDSTRPEPLQSLNAAPLDLQFAAPSLPASDPILAGLGLTDQVNILPPAPTAQPEARIPETEPLTLDPSGQSPPPVPPPLLPVR